LRSFGPNFQPEVLFFVGARSNALTGQSMVVSHGWFMQ
jgi:3-hydroxybutyrate dehydrogenase